MEIKGFQKKAELFSALREKYEVGDHYIQSYLDYWKNSGGENIRSLKDIDRLTPPKSMWFDYALSTNRRGKDIYNLMKPFIHKGHRRTPCYLDVGCGFGGCVVAFASEGIKAMGIEIDPQRVEFSRANALDHNMKNNIYQLNILDDIKHQLGQYDIITCTAVIEHVLDPAKAMRNLVGLLNDDGILMLQIPNKYSINFVACDGHFSLFGITLLDRPDAIEYHKCYFNSDYDVGYYHILPFYIDLAEQHGYHTKLISSVIYSSDELNSCEQHIYNALDAYQKFLESSEKNLTGYLRSKLSVLFKKYISRLIHDLTNIALGFYDAESFKIKYLTDFWTLIIRKKGTR